MESRVDLAVYLPGHPVVFVFLVNGILNREVFVPKQHGLLVLGQRGRAGVQGPGELPRPGLHFGSGLRFPNGGRLAHFSLG